MLNSTLDILQIIGGSIVAAITFVDVLTQRFVQAQHPLFKVAFLFLKKFRNKVAMLCLVTAAFIWINRKKEALAANGKFLERQHLDTVLQKHDSINQIRLDSSIKEATRAYSAGVGETMAKYYLKYDSSQHKISDMYDDTSKRLKIIEKVINTNSPELEVTEIHLVSFKGDSLIMSFVVQSKKMPVKGLNMKVKILYIKYNNFIPSINPTRSLFIEGELSSDEPMISEIIDNVKEKKLYKACYLFYGDYTYNGTKVFFTIIRSYNFTSNLIELEGDQVGYRKAFEKYYPN